MKPEEAGLAMELLLAPPPLLPTTQQLAQRLLRRGRDDSRGWHLLAQADPLWQLAMLPYSRNHDQSLEPISFRMALTSAFESPLLPTRLFPMAGQWQALGLATACVAETLHGCKPQIFQSLETCRTIARIHHWGELLVWWRFPAQAEQALRGSRNGMGSFARLIPRSLSGRTAARLGRLWASSWQLPSVIAQVIGTYEQPERLNKHMATSMLIAVSRGLAEIAGYRGPGQLTPGAFPASWWQEIGLSMQDLDTGLAALAGQEEACDLASLASQANA